MTQKRRGRPPKPRLEGEMHPSFGEGPVIPVPAMRSEGHPDEVDQWAAAMRHGLAYYIEANPDEWEQVSRWPTQSGFEHIIGKLNGSPG
jgi:hypothetical protein